MTFWRKTCDNQGRRNWKCRNEINDSRAVGRSISSMTGHAIGTHSRPVRFLSAALMVGVYMTLGFLLHPNVPNSHVNFADHSRPSRWTIMTVRLVATLAMFLCGSTPAWAQATVVAGVFGEVDHDGP